MRWEPLGKGPDSGRGPGPELGVRPSWAGPLQPGPEGAGAQTLGPRDAHRSMPCLTSSVYTLGSRGNVLGLLSCARPPQCLTHSSCVPGTTCPPLGRPRMAGEQNGQGSALPFPPSAPAQPRSPSCVVNG